MPDLTFRLVIENAGAQAKLDETGQKAGAVKAQAEQPINLKVQAENALGTIRDLKIAFEGVAQVVSGVVHVVNGYLDAALEARQSAKLAAIAFGDQAAAMSDFAQSMQQVTNFEGDQLLALMAKMAQTYNLNTSEIQRLTPVLLDFTEANKITGMTVETAFDLMGRAVNGHTEMLGKYGIELDDTRLKTEGVSYLVETLGERYGGTANALADMRLQNANAWGDVKETIGDMLQQLINPILQGLKSLIDWYNKLSPVQKGFVVGLAAAVPTIVSVTTVITSLTASYNALKLAINPVAGIIGIITGALAALGFAYASTKVAAEAATSGQKDFAEQVRGTTKSVEELVEEQRKIATSIDHAEAKRRLQEIEAEIAHYQDILLAMQSGPVLVADDFDPSKLEELQAQAGVLRDKVNADDEAAQKAFLARKTQFDREAALEGVALIKYRLSEARKAYADLGELDSENADKKQAAYERVKELEKQLSQAKKQAVSELQALDSKYTTAAIADTVARTQRELEIERDAELQKAASLGASEELLLKIRTVYAQRITKVEVDAAEARRKAAEDEARDKQRLADEAARTEREKSDIRDEFYQKQLELDDNSYQAQIEAVDKFYAQRREKLVAAGLTDEQIARQQAQAKAKIDEEYHSRAVSGLSGTLGNLATVANAFGKKGFALWKTLAVAQAMVDTYASANAAYKSLAGIPIVGPGLAIAAAAAAIGAGLANVYAISKTEPPKAASGGLLRGKTHAQGGIIIEAENDEYIINAARTRALGPGFLSFLNSSPLAQVKNFLGNISLPSFPVPTPQLAYASGGVVGDNGISGLLATLIEKVERLTVVTEKKQLALSVQVDPLSANPVKISELADKGKKLRAEV